MNSESTNDSKATQLPKPSGYRILCAVPEIEKPFLEWANDLKFILKDRAVLAKHPHISVAYLCK